MMTSPPQPTDVRLEPWGTDDLDLLRRNNAADMMEFLGGPETEEKVLIRHHRYLDGQRTGANRMFRIVLPEAPQGVGVIGYWPITWQDEPVYESGWSVETTYQGRGIATAALRAVLADAAARPHELRESQGSPDPAAGMSFRPAIHAFPKVVNTPSNAICRKAGFELAGECDFEYPPGNPIRCNDWVFRFDQPD